MGLLQLYLKAGVQQVRIPNQVPRGNVKIRHFTATFNVENHGYYQARLTFPFANVSNAQNNLSDSKSVILPLNHASSFTSEYLDFNLSNLEIPRTFEVSLDLDNGHQVVLESETRIGQPYEFRVGSELPDVADYVNNPPGGVPYVSLGVNAEKILNGTLPETSGLIDGPVGFMYSAVLTLEYDEGQTSERLQSFLG